MDVMNIVEIFGINVWLISIISENKKLDQFSQVKILNLGLCLISSISENQKLDQFSEVKNIETPKNIMSCSNFCEA